MDKMRAAGTSALDCYNYKTAGMDATLLQFLDVDGDAMERAVKALPADEEVLQWVDRYARRWTREEAVEFNRAILDCGQRTEEERQAFERRRQERYPDRPELCFFVDLIEADAGRPIRARPLSPSCYDPSE
jgi:hypothetical protein